MHNKLKEELLNSPQNIDENSTLLEETPKLSPYWKVPLWWFGLFSMILGELGNFTAYGLAPAVLVAPLGTVALISNAMIAPAFLNEEFRKHDFFGILLAIFGTIIIIAVIYSPTSQKELTMK